MTTRRLVFLGLAAVAGVASTGCGGDGGGLGETVAIADDAPLVDWETYRGSAEVVPDGLLVEWDLIFPTEEALYAYWQDEYGSGGRQALTIHRINVNGIATDVLWPYPQRLDLTYCVGSGFTSPQLTQLLPALDAAAEEWSRVAAVRHRRVSVSGSCDANNNEVVFNVRGVTGQTWNADAFFPSEPRSARELLVNDNAFTETGWGLDLKQILMHEFGHTLGFRHEHEYVPTVPTQCRAGQTNPLPRLVTPVNDEFSVMFYPYCRDPVVNGYWLSQWDIAGVVEIYGLAPALTQTLTVNVIDIN